MTREHVSCDITKGKGWANLSFEKLDRKKWGDKAQKFGKVS